MCWYRAGPAATGYQGWEGEEGVRLFIGYPYAKGKEPKDWPDNTSASGKLDKQTSSQLRQQSDNVKCPIITRANHEKWIA